MVWRRWHRNKFTQRKIIATACTSVILLLVLLPLLLWQMRISVPVPAFMSAIISLEDTATIECYSQPVVGSVDSLPDFARASPPPGQALFFHETSCKFDAVRGLQLDARQACAVESAALHHPTSHVYVLFTSNAPLRTAPPNNRSAPVHYLALLRRTYTNLRVYRVNVSDYVRGTRLERIYADGALSASVYAVSHASDLLRYLTLWKFGGIYLDLDVVVMRNLWQAGARNFAGYESPSSVAAGVLAFDARAYGHHLAYQCLLDLQANFDGRSWGSNGPGVITRLFRRICNASSSNYISRVKCGDFNAFPPEYFYPLHWQHWQRYFDTDEALEVLRVVNRSYAIHAWNKHSHGRRLACNSNVAYTQLARHHCPNVWKHCDKYF